MHILLWEFELASQWSMWFKVWIVRSSGKLLCELSRYQELLPRQSEECACQHCPEEMLTVDAFDGRPRRAGGVYQI